MFTKGVVAISRRGLVAGLQAVLVLGWVTAAAAQGSAHAGESIGQEIARQEAVQVRNGRVALAATLVMPSGGGPHPAVVVVPGAGEGLILPTHPLVQRLAQDGVAVLVLGKRGVGESTGDWRRESFEQRAQDVERAVELLRGRPDIDPQRVGLVGHSQGGWIVQLVAARSPELSFVVLLAGPGQTVFDQILTDERIHLERGGAAQEVVERKVGRLRWQIGALRTLAPACRALRAHYLCHIIRYDPVPALERIRIPVLAVFGELDPMVPPEPNVRLVREALERGGNPDVTIHVFPQANHDFLVARTGLRHEHHGRTPVYVEGFLDTVSEWIAERV